MKPWSWWQELNPWPEAYKATALPTELHQLGGKGWSWTSTGVGRQIYSLLSSPLAQPSPWFIISNWYLGVYLTDKDIVNLPLSCRIISDPHTHHRSSSWIYELLFSLSVKGVPIFYLSFVPFLNFSHCYRTIITRSHFIVKTKKLIFFRGIIFMSTEYSCAIYVFQLNY